DRGDRSDTEEPDLLRGGRDIGVRDGARWQRDSPPRPVLQGLRHREATSGNGPGGGDVRVQRHDGIGAGEAVVRAMLDWGDDRVDRLRLEAADPLGEVSGDEIQEHRVMRQAVVVELVISGTLLVEA